MKLSYEIPPIQKNNVNGQVKKKLAHYDIDKIKALHLYFSSISFIDNTNERLPNM